MKRHLLILAAMVGLGFAGHRASAATTYFNGFEPGDPGTRDFYDSTTNQQGANINIVSNGGGLLGLTAASGTHYAEITNTDDAYQAPGYGESVYTDYGLKATGSGVTGAPFFESTAYYINADWAAPTNPGVAAFWIDTTPATDPLFQDENSFQIYAPGNGTVQIGYVGGAPATTITTSGWYTFQTTFQEGANGNVENVLSVMDSLGNVLGSSVYNSTLPFASLTGTGYGDWTTVWQNGFGATNPGGSNGAADVLGIDNVTAGPLVAAPLPASSLAGFSLLAGLALYGGAKRLRKQTA